MRKFSQIVSDDPNFGVKQTAGF